MLKEAVIELNDKIADLEIAQTAIMNYLVEDIKKIEVEIRNTHPGFVLRIPERFHVQPIRPKSIFFI